MILTAIFIFWLSLALSWYSVLLNNPDIGDRWYDWFLLAPLFLIVGVSLVISKIFGWLR